MSCDFDADGFEWIDCNDAEQSTLSFIRRAPQSPAMVLVVCNFTPVPEPGSRSGFHAVAGGRRF